MKEVAIYGGAFNPPTIAHAAVISTCLKQPGIDEVWVMPSADRFDKQFNIDKVHRLTMLELLKQSFDAKEAERIMVSRLEIEELPAPTETRRTYEELKQRHPACNFRFVFGSDAYRAMSTWPGGDELQRTLPMFVSPRFTEELTTTPNIKRLPEISCSEVSSTVVREALQQQRPLNGFVPVAIKRYIEEQKLYRAKFPV